MPNVDNNKKGALKSGKTEHQRTLCWKQAEKEREEIKSWKPLNLTLIMSVPFANLKDP